MKGLTELYLSSVHNINIQSFIEFLRLRPNLEVFHHCDSFKRSKEEVFEALAECCGNQIQDFQDGGRDIPPLSFIAALKTLKRVHLPTNQYCGGDVVAAIRQLAQKDTIEKLKLSYYPFERHNTNCILQKNDVFGMKGFSHLETIDIRIRYAANSSNRRVCDTLKLFTVYSSQILSHVENLIIDQKESDVICDWNFIRFVPKLRNLIFIGGIPNSGQADKILSMLQTILQNRQNERSSGDVIKVKFSDDRVLNSFVEIAGHGDSIKLAKLNKYEKDKLIRL